MFCGALQIDRMETTSDLPANLVQEIEVRATQNGHDLSKELIEPLRRGLAAPQVSLEVARPLLETAA
jgi:hypothetical protein